MKKDKRTGVIGCAFCGSRYLLHQCNYCGNLFCQDHLLPEAHSCSGLGKRDWETYRREREKRIGGPPVKRPVEHYHPIIYYEKPKTHEIAKSVVVLIMAIVAIWILLQLLS